MGMAGLTALHCRCRNVVRALKRAALSWSRLGQHDSFQKAHVASKLALRTRTFLRTCRVTRNKMSLLVAVLVLLRTCAEKASAFDSSIFFFLCVVKPFWYSENLAKKEIYIHTYIFLRHAPECSVPVFIHFGWRIIIYSDCTTQYWEGFDIHYFGLLEKAMWVVMYLQLYIAL